MKRKALQMEKSAKITKLKKTKKKNENIEKEKKTKGRIKE